MRRKSTTSRRAVSEIALLCPNVAFFFNSATVKADSFQFIRQPESAWSADSGRSAAPQTATLSNSLNT